VAVGVGVAEPRPRDARPVGALPLVVTRAAAAQRLVPVTVVVVVMPVERQPLSSGVAAVLLVLARLAVAPSVAAGEK
jgi:hypothetical protein